MNQKKGYRFTREFRALETLAELDNYASDHRLKDQIFQCLKDHGIAYSVLHNAIDIAHSHSPDCLKLLRAHHCRDLIHKLNELVLHSSTNLGRILVHLGHIAEHQLEEALAHHQQSSRPLGEILVDCGHISLHALHDASVLQHNLRSYLLAAAMIVLCSGFSMYMEPSFAATVASAEIMITLRIPPRAPVTFESNEQTGRDLLVLHGAKISGAYETGYVVTPIDSPDIGQSQQEIDLSELSSGEFSGQVYFFVAPP